MYCPTRTILNLKRKFPPGFIWSRLPGVEAWQGRRCVAVNGLWSTWSSWSTCGPDCKHHRRRICDNPAPRNGGNFCPGNDLTTYNCTGSMCQGECPTVRPASTQSLSSVLCLMSTVLYFLRTVRKRFRRVSVNHPKPLRSSRFAKTRSEAIFTSFLLTAETIYCITSNGPEQLLAAVIATAGSILCSLVFTVM